MLKIMKASAGSGKTYNLAKEYLRILLTSTSRDAYRHILAVTFTNMATDEMKRRILKELHTLAVNPQTSPYLQDFIPAVAPNTGKLQEMAAAQLSRILHDYSCFAVSTIDKFFQQTLRAFSREVGQFASYQVELDRDMLISESVDRVLDSLAEGGDKELLDWVVRGVKNDLETTGRFNLDAKLKDMATSLLSLAPGEKTTPRDRLRELTDTCDRICLSFNRSVRQLASQALEILRKADVDPADSNRAFLGSLAVYADLSDSEAVPAVTASWLDKALDPQKWFPKKNARMLAFVEDELASPLTTFANLFDEPFRTYSTARTIRSQVCALGMADELRKAFTEVQKEKNVLSIDDTNAIIHQIIDGSDTPFIYEKLGVRYEDFLLDEFQDMSGVQWENFLPLIQNSESQGKDSLIVGDVKQSIYRWRGSDWDLLGKGVQQTFGIPDSGVTVLDTNWRSLRNIVSFNNAFFPYAAGEMDRLLGLDPASPDSVSHIYADVAQLPGNRESEPGHVAVRFVDDTAAEMDATVEAIRSTRERGARWGDIAILVRGNAEGSEIAARLVNEGIPVVSDDALYVKGAVTVRRLVAQLALVSDPTLADGKGVEGYLAREMHVDIPTGYHTLTTLAEGILASLREADPKGFAMEVPHVQAFMDYLHDWEKKYGNDLGAFLKEWAEANPKIVSPSLSDAVRVMTVHKSKGLEFPHVIFPFAEKVTIYKPAGAWCRPDTRGTLLEGVTEGRFRINLSDGSAATLFRKDYTDERLKQAVDNINVFYVALTRARCELTVISVKPPKGLSDAFAKGTSIAPKNFSQILYGYTQCDDWSFGQPYDYSALRRDTGSEEPLTLDYLCDARVAGSRLRFHIEDEEADGTVPSEESAPETTEEK